MMTEVKNCIEHMIFHLEAQQQLKDCLKLLKMILGPDLLSVYLYGSSVFGGLQKYSDIDLLVVTKRATTSVEKSRLATHLLKKNLWHLHEKHNFSYRNDFCCERKS